MSEPLHQLYPNVPFKQAYHIREAARYMGWSRCALRQAIERGDLQALRPNQAGGRGLKIPGVELRAWIDRSIFDPHA